MRLCFGLDALRISGGTKWFLKDCGDSIRSSVSNETHPKVLVRFRFTLFQEPALKEEEGGEINAARTSVRVVHYRL